MSIVDVEFRRLQEELLQKKAEAEDLESQQNAMQLWQNRSGYRRN